MKILVIDDSKEDRDLIITHIKKFKKKPIQTEESNCLKDGLCKLKSCNYDVIILDLFLPESDGIETIKATINHLKQINKDIPIIVLTGMEDYSVGREAWALGIKDYLIKDEIQTQDLSRALTFATYNHKSILIK